MARNSAMVPCVSRTEREATTAAPIQSSAPRNAIWPREESWVDRSQTHQPHFPALCPGGAILKRHELHARHSTAIAVAPAYSLPEASPRQKPQDFAGLRSAGQMILAGADAAAPGRGSNPL